MQKESRAATIRRLAEHEGCNLAELSAWYGLRCKLVRAAFTSRPKAKQRRATRAWGPAEPGELVASIGRRVGA